MKLAVTLLIVGLGTGIIWACDNELNKLLHKECPTGQAFYKWTSTFTGYHRVWFFYTAHQDRCFSFFCRRCPSLAKGQRYKWYNNVNRMDQVLSFKCTDKLEGGVLCGVKSYHSDKHEDRVWSFKCCASTGKKACKVPTKSTNYINTFQGAINWQTPSSDQFMIGFYSYHSNDKEDRRWKVHYGQPICPVWCACSGNYDNNWVVKTIDYQLKSYTKGSQKPEVVATKIIDNNHPSAESTVTFTVTKSVKETSTFSHRVGASIMVATSFKAKIPFFGEAENSVTFGASYDYTWGKTTTFTRQISSRYSLKAPPKTHAIGKAIMTKGIFHVPFTMTLRHKSYGCTCAVKGTWSGLEHYNLRFTVDKIKTY